MRVARVVGVAALILSLYTAAIAAAPIVLSNNAVNITFGDEQTHFQLMNVTSQNTGYGFLVHPISEWWSAEFVTKSATTQITVSSGDASVQSLSHHTQSYANGTQLLTLSWNGIAVGTDRVNVQMSVTLNEYDSFASFLPSVQPTQSGAVLTDIGLWSFSISVSAIGAPNGDTVYDTAVLPVGFGARIDNPCGNPPKPYDAVYPSSLATYQVITFTHAVPHIEVMNTGLYFGSHDVHASPKELAYSISETCESTVSVLLTPPGAGQAFGGYAFTTPIVLGAYFGDWWDAAQIYRGWAINNADWTVAGPLSDRTDVPIWLQNMTTWINTGWQQLDIFNATQGDPSVVLANVQAINSRFNIPNLGLHWYVWDEIAFDTGYPQYFPAKPGFATAVQTLQDQGIKIAPYINGRIFDIHTAKWSKDGAVQYAAKSCSPVVNSTQLTVYEESYGSGATFALMCPHTLYWDSVISGTVQTLVSEYGLDGVYIDQIGAATPKLCFDPTHNHTVGGGTWWVDGYKRLLVEARAGAGPNAMLLTESNSESYMSYLDVYLTLVAFSLPIVGAGSIVPFFPAVYGGYTLLMGAEFYQSDLTESSPDVFAAKCAIMYATGAQIGWFSLAGTSDAPAMGLLSLFMDPKYDPEVAYLQLLASYKHLGNAYFVNAIRTRDIPIVQSDSTPRMHRTHVRATSSEWTHEHAHTNGGKLSVAEIGPFAVPPLIVGSEFGSSMLVTLTSPLGTGSVDASFNIDLSNYGFVNSFGQLYSVTQMWPDGSSSILGTYTGTQVQYSGTIAARAVVLLLIQMA